MRIVTLPQELVVRGAPGSGMQEVGYIEPKPGIPPTADHTAQLIKLMKSPSVLLVIVESFYPTTWPASSPRTATRVWSAAPSDVGATPAIKNYFDLVDAVIAALTKK